MKGFNCIWISLLLVCIFMCTMQRARREPFSSLLYFVNGVKSFFRMFPLKIRTVCWWKLYKLNANVALSQFSWAHCKGWNSPLIKRLDFIPVSVPNLFYPFIASYEIRFQSFFAFFFWRWHENSCVALTIIYTFIFSSLYFLFIICYRYKSYTFW